MATQELDFKQIAAQMARTCRAGSYRVEKNSTAAKQPAVCSSHPEVGGRKADVMFTGSDDRIINMQERPAPEHGPVDVYPTLGSPNPRITIGTTIYSCVSKCRLARLRLWPLPNLEILYLVCTVPYLPFTASSPSISIELLLACIRENEPETPSRRSDYLVLVSTKIY